MVAIAVAEGAGPGYFYVPVLALWAVAAALARGADNPAAPPRRRHCMVPGHLVPPDPAATDPSIQPQGKGRAAILCRLGVPVIEFTLLPN